jgi:hypothetical protein
MYALARCLFPSSWHCHMEVTVKSKTWWKAISPSAANHQLRESVTRARKFERSIIEWCNRPKTGHTNVVSIMFSHSACAPFTRQTMKSHSWSPHVKSCPCM